MEELKSNGKKQIIAATNALSMGVNFPDIRYVVNWGPARNILDHHQEAGRAGRHNVTSDVVIIFHGQQLSQCEDDVKSFLRASGCLRVASYKAFDESIKPLEQGHDCCTNCRESCLCQGDTCCIQTAN
ncbi:mediator of RNA polymerase II transcription subunit 34-like [Actinia tenebrosa]|uniref:DNA 3'-5' helicase n=1 Tax=Actinia tenebrosa TaxID=6105 RepID=A0A6P8HQ29_ACTTE|nr:mediator of RNA polymerase II transcription subunit 34-like [Actinia tenebrosa]